MPARKSARRIISGMPGVEMVQPVAEAAEHRLVAAGVQDKRGIVVPHRLEVGLDRINRDVCLAIVVRRYRLSAANAEIS
jgi:hypothetical protein